MKLNQLEPNLTKSINNFEFLLQSLPDICWKGYIDIETQHIQVSQLGVATLRDASQEGGHLLTAQVGVVEADSLELHHCLGQ